MLYILTVSEPQPTCCGDWEHWPPSREKFCWDDPDWRRDWANHSWGSSEKGQRTGPRCTFWKLGGCELLSVLSTLLALPQLLITLLRVTPASVCFCSTSTGAPSLAGTSSLWLNCTRERSSTTAQCSAHWIDHTLLRCCSSRTFSHPLFRQWRPRWRRRASPAATCSVSVSTVWQAAGNGFSLFIFLNGNLFYTFFPHSWFAIWGDSVITQDVPGSSETRNNNRTKSVSPPSIEVDFRHFNMVDILSTIIQKTEKCVLQAEITKSWHLHFFPQWRESDTVCTRVVDPHWVVHQLQSVCVESERHLHCSLWTGVHLLGESIFGEECNNISAKLWLHRNYTVFFI